MLTPQQLDDLPVGVTEIYEDAETDIIAEMSRKIAEVQRESEGDELSTRQKIINNAITALQIYTTSRLAKAFVEAQPVLINTLDYAVTSSLSFDDSLYRALGFSPIPIAENAVFQVMMQEAFNIISTVLQNITMSTAQGMPQQFFDILNIANTRTAAGASPSTSTVAAVKELAKQGIAFNSDGWVYYESAHRDRIDVVVRRVVMTESNRQTGRVQLRRAQEMGIDLMELTAHNDARPEHAAWQGQVVSLSGAPGYLNLWDIGYGDVAGFQGANCRHSWFPFAEGFSTRAYTDEILRRYENQSVVYNDQVMTYYEASQLQRYFERGIRDWKRQEAAVNGAGFDASDEAVKVREWQARLKNFSDQTGLARQRDREQV